MDAALLLEARALVLATCKPEAGGPRGCERARGRRLGARLVGGPVPEGVQYVAGLVAQDVQDALFEAGVRWPLCHTCAREATEHSVYISPDLGGPDPVWVCEVSGDVVAPLGRLEMP